ncbi:alkaline phosphatase D family protein [Alsobacter sp. R-9]
MIWRPTRRALLAGTGALVAAPAISRAADRPQAPLGVQSGDTSAGSGMAWIRSDRPARAIVEASTTESFRDVAVRETLELLPATDLTGKLRLDGLPAGQEVFYRFTLFDLYEPALKGATVSGRFRTAPSDPGRSVSFVWSGDTAGQGWGIDPARGGMRTYATMLGHRPDFFIHSGDTIYADNPLEPEVRLADGSLWKNLLVPEKLRVAQTLDEFRGNWRYNLLDDNLRLFNAEVPTFAQWDDHDVTDNWWPDQPLDRPVHAKRGYTERFMTPLAANARRAFHEYMPVRPNLEAPGRIYRKISWGPHCDVFMLDMRSERGPNGDNRQDRAGPDAAILGAAQLAWLQRELAASTATWKFIAADQPLGLIVFDDFVTRTGSEAVGQGAGPPLGRELEIAALLRFIRDRHIRNTVWLTADVHYTAAHRYDPGRAVFQEFEPFWEFVSGPIHAGTFGPNALDPTFGPEAVFVKAPPPGQFNLPPSAGLQFFGHCAIDGGTGRLTVTLRDVADMALWAVTLDPQR